MPVAEDEMQDFSFQPEDHSIFTAIPHYGLARGGAGHTHGGVGCGDGSLMTLRRPEPPRDVRVTPAT